MKIDRKKLLLAGLAMGLVLVAPVMAVHAQKEQVAASSQDAPAVPDGAVEIYGQVLRPGLVEFRVSDYTWQDLKSLLPELLPDADQLSLSPEQVCDRIVSTTEKWLIESEKSTNELIYEMEYFVKAGIIEPPADLAVTDRLASPSADAFYELLEVLPDREEQIKIAKAIKVRSLAMILLHDAALANCPEYAQKMEYAPITTYSGTD